MTEGLDISKMAVLLDADWLEDEYKEILKSAIKRSIKLLPLVIGMLEDQLEEYTAKT